MCSGCDSERGAAPQLILEDEGPQFPAPLRARSDIEKLRVPDAEQDLGFVMEAIRRTLKRLDGRVPLIGFCGGPWTLAAYMIEGKTSRSFEKERRSRDARRANVTPIRRESNCGNAELRTGLRTVHRKALTQGNPGNRARVGKGQEDRRARAGRHGYA